MISGDDLLWYVDKALDGMVEVVESLGDDLVNRRPDLPGANSPYSIVFHCCGVIEWWGRQVVAGEPVDRDRPAEFRATGTVAELLERVRSVRAGFADDVAGAVPTDPPRGRVADVDRAEPLGRTQGGALVHVLEELAQHRGQLELTRDLLRREA